VPDRLHMQRHDQARVLRDVVARRAIVDRNEQTKARGDARVHDGVSIEPHDEVAERIALEWCCRQLATVYACHPDYRAADWAP
jgi:hypothetical protein